MLFDFLAQASPVSRTVLALSLTIALGLAIGRVSFRGASLGVGLYFLFDKALDVVLPTGVLSFILGGR